MDIIIGRRMRELRDEKKNTQEQLAAYLGVSAQAVSKWEREENFPDIELLPSIASFYGVTVDYLLGVGEREKQKKIEAYVKKARMLRRQGRIADCVSLWREARREFPEEPAVLHQLSHILQEEDFQGNHGEITDLSRRLLEKYDQSGQYFGAVRALCLAAGKQGDMQEAKRFASMAGRYQGTENQLMIRILDGEEAVSFCQGNIQTLTDLISSNVKSMLRKGCFSVEEKIRAVKYVLNVFALLYDDGNYGFYHCRICGWHMKLAALYMQKEDRDMVLAHVRKAVQHAETFDALQDGSYTAFLVNRQCYSTGGEENNGNGSALARVRKTLDEWEHSDFPGPLVSGTKESCKTDAD